MRAWRLDPLQSDVTVNDVKRNARVDGDDDDLIIQGLINAAHVRAEEETGRIYGEGQWIIHADAETTRLTSPVWPITVAPTGWTVENKGRVSYLVPGDWPVDNLITVTAGEPMPETVRQAIILLATHWYDNRGTMATDSKGEMPLGVSSLLGLARRVFV